MMKQRVYYYSMAARSLTQRIVNSNKAVKKKKVEYGPLRVGVLSVFSVWLTWPGCAHTHKHGNCQWVKIKQDIATWSSLARKMIIKGALHSKRDNEKNNLVGVLLEDFWIWWPSRCCWWLLSTFTKNRSYHKSYSTPI